MSFVRAPTMPGFFGGIPSQYAGLVVVENVHHIGALFPLTLLGEALNKTACGLPFRREPLTRIVQPCTEVPADLCEKCRAWVERDRAQQDAEPPLPLLTCLACDGLATWVRYTQFSGNHPFCDAHARQEEDFGKSDDSYFFWEALDESGGTEFDRYQAHHGP